jgi:signal peptidase II
MPEPRTLWWRWLLVSVVVIALDQLTKGWIVSALYYGEEIPVTSFFSVVMVYNTGAAFSFLAQAAGWQRYVFIGLALGAAGLLTFLLRRGGSAIYCSGLALILGGALGNAWDRVSIGKVVDFLLFYYHAHQWPAFNVADSAITIGAGLLILDSFRQRRV